MRRFIATVLLVTFAMVSSAEEVVPKEPEAKEEVNLSQLAAEAQTFKKVKEVLDEELKFHKDAVVRWGDCSWDTRKAVYQLTGVLERFERVVGKKGATRREIMDEAQLVADLSYVYCEFGVFIFPLSWQEKEDSYLEAHKKMEGILSSMKKAKPDADTSGFTAGFLEQFRTQIGLVEKLAKARARYAVRQRRTLARLHTIIPRVELRLTRLEKGLAEHEEENSKVAIVEEKGLKPKKAADKVACVK